MPSSRWRQSRQLTMRGSAESIMIDARSAPARQQAEASMLGSTAVSTAATMPPIEMPSANVAGGRLTASTTGLQGHRVQFGVAR